jgi:hypothetical protein
LNLTPLMFKILSNAPVIDSTSFLSLESDGPGAPVAPCEPCAPPGPFGP